MGDEEVCIIGKQDHIKQGSIVQIINVKDEE